VTTAPATGPLVSVIIPCRDAERWVGEAIDSALAQTYRWTEVVVVDDGSTDGSLAVIEGYGERVRWESGPPRGGNAARNRGLRLSRGELIQWLDADDYLMQEKLERQVHHLRAQDADVVFGDWRDEHVDPRGGRRAGPVVSAESSDVLFDLLRGRWTPHHAYLMRRRAVEAVGGWDETLPVLQDPDLLIRVCIAGARFAYQPGCHAVYRRHGDGSHSARNRSHYPRVYAGIVERAGARLEAAGRLTAGYRRALALSHFHVARNFYETDRGAWAYHLRRTLELDPVFRPRESRLFNVVAGLLGLGPAERAAVAKRRWLRTVRGLVRSRRAGAR
jgi:glycosyltransferase involved in cell wall biosynthesis